MKRIGTGCAVLRRRAPMALALLGVAAVWLVGCWWSFTEQRAFAEAKGFGDPTLLPLVLDGLAASMAGVAYAASLDGRPAVGARIGTAIAVAASATSNGVWAWERSQADPATVALAIGIPIAANLAFEVLLGELRRQVQRTRGLPAPAAIPLPRLARLLLAPWNTFGSWRRHVLDVTDPGRDGRVELPGTPKTPWDGVDPDLGAARVPDDLATFPAALTPDPTLPSRPAARDVADDGDWCIDAGSLSRAVPRDPGRDDDTQPLGLPGASGHVNGRDDPDSGSPQVGRPGDAEIVAALAKRSPLPGIGTIRAEFGVGAGRAGRLQKQAERLAEQVS